jgi:putative sigma-54 modulation protein
VSEGIRATPTHNLSGAAHSQLASRTQIANSSTRVVSSEGLSLAICGAIMNLKISGRHLEVTPSLREYTVTKLERVLRDFEDVIEVTVLLSVDKRMQKSQCAEVYVHRKGRGVFVESSDGDVYAAIDLLAAELDQQVVWHKTRLQEHHHDVVRNRSTDMTISNDGTDELFRALSPI